MRLELQLFKNINNEYGEPEWTTIYRSDDTSEDNIAFQDFSLSEGINEISKLSFTMYPNEWVKYFNLDDPDNAVYEVWFLQIEETEELDPRLAEQGYIAAPSVPGHFVYEKILFAGTVVEFSPIYDDGAVTFEVVCADLRDKMRNIIQYRRELQIKDSNVQEGTTFEQGTMNENAAVGSLYYEVLKNANNRMRYGLLYVKFPMSIATIEGYEIFLLMFDSDDRYTGIYEGWAREHNIAAGTYDNVNSVGIVVRKANDATFNPENFNVYYRDKLNPAGIEGAIKNILDNNNWMYTDVIHAYGLRPQITPKVNRTLAILEYNALYSAANKYHYVVDWESTYDALKNVILDRYGGEIRLHHRSLISNRYEGYDADTTEHARMVYKLEYIDTPSTPSDTSELETLRNYDNLLYLKVNTEREEFCTALIPLGATDLAGNRLILDGQTTGSIFSKTSRETAENYGIKIRTHTWDDVTIQSNLERKGTQWMANQNRATKTYEARVYDLSIIDRDRKPIQLGDFYHVVVDTPYMQIDEVLRVIYIKRDLFNFHAPEIVLGDKRMSFEELQANAQKLQANKLNTSIYNTNEAIQELKE